MYEWNGKVGDVISPYDFYDIEDEHKIGFEGGRKADHASVSIYRDTKLVLLDVGPIECVTRVSECQKSGPSITDQSFERTYGLVFKIPTSVLVGWWKEAEQRKKADALYEITRAKRVRQNELDRDKWCQ